jgi:hypothetical protein
MPGISSLFFWYNEGVIILPLNNPIMIERAISVIKIPKRALIFVLFVFHLEMRNANANNTRKNKFCIAEAIQSSNVKYIKVYNHILLSPLVLSKYVETNRTIRKKVIIPTIESEYPLMNKGQPESTNKKYCNPKVVAPQSTKTVAAIRNHLISEKHLKRPYTIKKLKVRTNARRILSDRKISFSPNRSGRAAITVCA